MTDRRPTGPRPAAGETGLGDLAASAALATVLAVAIVWADGLVSARSDLAAAVFALPLVVVLPGYALLACVTPTRRPAPRPLVVVPAVSLVVSAAAALVLAAAPVAATAGSLGVALAALTVGASALAVVRRRGGSAGPPVDWAAALPSRRPDGGVPVAFLAVTGIVLVACVAYVGVAAPPPERFTSLSAHPQADDVTLDSFELSAGEETALVVAVENHEGERAEYTLVARVEVVRTAGGGTGDNEKTVLGRQSSERFRLTLGPGERWERNHTVSPDAVPGRQRLVYYLYRGDAPGNPTEASAYRTAEIWEPVETGSE